MNRFTKTGFFLLIGLMLTQCGSERMKVPDGMMKPDELVPLLIDLHLADGYLHNVRTTQYKKRDSALTIYPGILKKYNLTRPELDSIVYFYGQYPDEFSKIYEKVMEELSRMEGEAREADTLRPAEEIYE